MKRVFDSEILITLSEAVLVQTVCTSSTRAESKGDIDSISCPHLTSITELGKTLVLGYSKTFYYKPMVLPWFLDDVL
eukprot:snap_masked-scaffold_44-processed-gene-1.69-mRNA-1 protein AED:1.00 eAED:1.00 QI:0/0/0/0/1/1/3/0/76